MSWLPPRLEWRACRRCATLTRARAGSPVSVSARAAPIRGSPKDRHCAAADSPVRMAARFHERL